VNSDKCIGCNKCVKVCPVKIANRTRLKEGLKDEFITEVNTDKCINCGECVKVCEHGARGYNDHIAQLEELMFNSEKFIIIVAPSVKTAFLGEDWKHMLQWFKDNTKADIYDVALGADICTWAYARYIEANPGVKLISQPCPAIVNYIEKYEPRLTLKLAPVHSPASCLAVYLKKYLGQDGTPIVLLSPCIAKTSEALKFNTFNLNVTFNSLQKYFKEKGMDFSNLGQSKFKFDGDVGILGQLFPRPGGLKDNISVLNSDLVVRTAEGPQFVYKSINRYASMIDNKRPDLLDVLNCQHGCNEGTASTHNNLIEIESAMDSLENTAQKSRGFFFSKDKIYKQFDKSLNYKDFMCSYQNKYQVLEDVPDEEIDRIFKEMLKTTPATQTINCGSCGYETCKDMACMIHRGLNAKENCVFYMKHKLASQIDDLKSITDILTEEYQTLLKALNKLTQDANMIKEISENSSSTSTSLINDIESISGVIANYRDYFSDISIQDMTDEDINSINELFRKLESIFTESLFNRISSNSKNDNNTISAIKTTLEQIATLNNTIDKLGKKITELNSKM
jgi:ferredoxin